MELLSAGETDAEQPFNLAAGSKSDAPLYSLRGEPQGLTSDTQ